MNTRFNKIFFGIFASAWLFLILSNFIVPDAEFSESERRPLATMPKFTLETLLNGDYARGLDTYTTDQFVYRETFRKTQSLFHYYVLNQKDINGIYIHDGYAAKLEYPLNPNSIDYAVGRFTFVYDKFLKDSGSKVYMAVVPDKGYYLTQENNYPAMDYDKLFQGFQAGMPWATHIDLTGALNKDSYYFTDTHWRQEKLSAVAQAITQTMSVGAFDDKDFTQTPIDRPFYGVYHGQAALPMNPETLSIMEHPILSQCKVFDHETGQYTDVYNMDMLSSKDLYDVFLSGAKSLLTIENPNAATEKELIIFRDSFGSSIAPLLVKDYAKVTLVDIRYLLPNMLDKYINFQGQDVLFLYSSLVLNNSSTIK